MHADGTHGKKKIRLFKKIVFVLLLNLFLVVVIVEGVLRFIPVPGFRPADLDPPYLASEAEHRTIPHPYLSYCLKPNWHTGPDAKAQVQHNSLGLRGPETTIAKPALIIPASVAAIVLMSTSRCFTCESSWAITPATSS